MTLSLEETMARLHCKRRKVFDLLKDGRLAFSGRACGTRKASVGSSASVRRAGFTHGRA